jgi:hypothetical protein
VSEGESLTGKVRAVNAGGMKLQRQVTISGGDRELWAKVGDGMRG